MGSVTVAIDTAFRDYATDGVPSSGEHEPVKSQIRLIGPAIEAMIGTAAGGGVAVAVSYATRAELYGDLAHAAGSFGVVYADPDPAKTGLYVKSGGSGSGAWTKTDLVLGPEVLAAIAALDVRLDAAEEAIESRIGLFDVVSVSSTGANAIKGRIAEAAVERREYRLRSPITNTNNVSLSLTTNVDAPDSKPLRDFVGGELAAGTIKTNRHYKVMANGDPVAEYRLIDEAVTVGDLAAVSGDIADVADDLADLADDVDGLSGDVDTLDGRVDLVEADVEALEVVTNTVAGITSPDLAVALAPLAAAAKGVLPLSVPHP